MTLSEETAGVKQGMRARLDEGLPMLALMGFSCWMAWNSIGFSGAFWLHDIENSLRAENPIIVHLIASTVALVLAAACASRLRKVATHPAFVVASGLVAAAGTLFSHCPSTPCAPTSAPSTPNSACTPAKSSAISSASARLVPALNKGDDGMEDDARKPLVFLADGFDWASRS